MLDFHVHSFASDGALGPAEIFRRARVAGIDVVGISDHADFSNAVRLVQENLQAASRERRLHGGVIAFAGIELTHVRPAHIPHLAQTARHAGAEYVIVHGETVVEPVEPGTNRSAIEAHCDILAHPGLISAEDAALAAQNGVLLEISSKDGHSLSNGHVASVARETGASLVFGSDTHLPGHLKDRDAAARVLQAAGLDAAEVEKAFSNALDLFRRLFDQFVRKDVDNGEK
ncbi:MAG: histidinol phosphate phosphatase domain-containing protein [Planctomycetes bacterium]|nr:histidinol phosphate phosphatase domain-containing protein [Planctomycetota bacterium]